MPRGRPPCSWRPDPPGRRIHHHLHAGSLLTAPHLALALADRYRIERELGAGGMATVHLALDLKHHRQVAIKVLRPELAAALGPERFLREIETTAGLRHPHILPLYDSGQAGEFLFYVMPYVEGESLRDRLKRDRQLPIDDALQIAREVADALGYAHARGIVHRDIKPENILIEGGHAVVADFGIARAVSAAGGERLTQTGLAIGTPYYMSPEQAAGDPDVDGRSDLYSLGCVLYEMLGGQPPFTGPTAQAVTRQHLVAEAAPITNLRPTVPPEVAGALARTLAKNPADRFNPAAQFVQALAAPAATTKVTARPVPLRPVLLGLMVVLLAAAAWLGSRRLTPRGAGPAIERIAVLPMDNQTGDSGKAFFADGMTRELIGVLTEAGVRVLGHRAVAAYRGSPLPAPQIAKELGVDAIVTGAVLQAGDQVQVAAELTDPASGENLWARTFSRPATGVVSLQHEIAAEIARGIQARLTPEQERVLSSAGTVNPEAYAQYLRGQEQTTFRTPDGYRRGVEHLTRSLALDSTFAPAWATLAIAHAYGLLYMTADRDSARVALEQAATRAIRLDDRLGDPYFALGLARLHTDWDFAGAEDAFQQGLRRGGSTLARALYAWAGWEVGRFSQMIATSRAHVDLEPTTAQWHSDLAFGLWSAGDSAAARVATLQAIEADSTFYEAHDLLAYLEMDAGDPAAAERAQRNARRHAGGDYWFRPLMEGLIAAAWKDQAGVRRVLAELSNDPRLAQRAVIHMALGDRDEVYRLLSLAIDARDPDVLWILNAHRRLHPLRGEPRYQQLLARIGLPGAR